MKTFFALLATVGVAAIVGCGRELPTSPTQAQTSPATPMPPAGSPEATLTAVSFTVFEYQYGNGPWTYAPRLEVMETQGKSAAQVTQMRFTIPGLGDIRPYNTTKCVAPGEQRTLLLEFYGDYEFEISGSTRATGGSASVVVQYYDGAGRAGTLTASGPITPGAPPTTYSGGRPTWGCTR